MRLELGCPVRCTDGPFGEVADVVIDPHGSRVTHLVVAPHHRHGLARLVPIDLATGEDGARPGVALQCSVQEARRLAPVQDFAYLRPSEFRAADPDWDVGVENVFLLPYYGYGGLGPEPMDYEGNIAVRYDRVPKGEVEIQRASTVVSADGHRLGHVDGFLVEDQDDHITHVVLERGHLWGKREVTIPIGAVKSVKTDSVALNLTKDEVGALESVQVRR